MFSKSSFAVLSSFLYSRKHSWTSQASKARNRTSCFMSSRRGSSSKTLRTRRSLEDVLLSESFSILVSRMRDKQIDMRCCLSVASSSNDYDNRTSGLRAQDVFAPFFLVLSLSVTKEKEYRGYARSFGAKAWRAWVTVAMASWMVPLRRPPAAFKCPPPLKNCSAT